MKKRFALVGQNIDHSPSPKIHQMIHTYLGKDAEYTLFSVEPEHFEMAVSELFKFDGFNVTQPYKNLVTAFLDINMNGTGPVNTVMWYEGQKMGYNTDYYGFNTSLVKRINPENLSVLVLGAGGVADPVVRNLTKLGAQVYIYSRTFQKAEELAQKRGAMAVQDKTGKFDIVVNCTPYGQNAGENAGDGIDFSETKLAFDTIYAETEFLKTAQAAGVAKTVDGLEMLVYQAIYAEELFFETDVEDIEELAMYIVAEVRKDAKST